MRSGESNGGLLRLSRFIAEAMGLHFPPSRWPELRRGVAAAAGELGFQDAAACVRGLSAAPPTGKQIEILADHLTIGETYFYRDERAFEVLAEKILPGLLDTARGNGRRLRVWSAGCCTGEEAYSIAILLRRAIPDWESWDVTLLATDINPCFVRKAEAGVFGEWSFRNAPAWLKRDYFHPAPDGRFAITPEIRRMVRFAQLNLAKDVYPSPATNTDGMDVIFCRNVLMYFTTRQARRVVERLCHAQAKGGWLFVGPSECRAALFLPYTTTVFNDTTVYHIDSYSYRVVIDSPPITVVQVDPPSSPQLGNQVERADPQPDPVGESAGLYERGCYAEAAAMLESFLSRQPREPEALRLLARALANQGKLAEALRCCDQWIATEKLSPSGHYLRAMVLQERGELDEAVRSLQRVVCLDPGFVMAHFALRNIARHRGRDSEAAKHLANALRSLRSYRPDDAVPESDGLTAGLVSEMIRPKADVEAAA